MCGIEQPSPSTLPHPDLRSLNRQWGPTIPVCKLAYPTRLHSLLHAKQRFPIGIARGCNPEKRRFEMLIILLIVVLVLVLGGGGGYYGYNRWGSGGGAGIGLGTILLILLLCYLLGLFR